MCVQADQKHGPNQNLRVLALLVDRLTDSEALNRDATLDGRGKRQCHWSADTSTTAGPETKESTPGYIKVREGRMQGKKGAARRARNYIRKNNREEQQERLPSQDSDAYFP